MKTETSFFSRNAEWLIPLVFFIIIAPLTPGLDLGIERYFYSMESESGHRFVNNIYTHIIYHYGPWPTLIVSVLAGLGFCFSYISSNQKHWRRPLLVITLTMAIGSGLLVHLVFKDHWGRPRPKQVIEFGGSHAFQPFYVPNLTLKIGREKSFPCGHCSMGYYFFGFALAARRLQSHRWFNRWLLFALVWGSILGICRMAQGGHFFSDVIAAGVIMWLTALFSEWLVYEKEIV